MTTYTIPISDSERVKLEQILSEEAWETGSLPHAFWKAKKGPVNLVAYNSGKLTVQGSGTEDFVLFTLEPRVTGKAVLGQGIEGGPDSGAGLAFPHAGMDESGKGDFFGPLVIAAVFADQSMARELVKAGVKDSKLIKNDNLIVNLAEKVRRIVGGKFSIVPIGPEAYNRLYAKIGNLNRLLAWGHARALENLLDKVPGCDSALADKFGNEALITRALLAKGRNVRLVQQTKAESDVAVAAASILARAEFVRRIKELGDELGTVLPKGAGLPVDQKARELAASSGSDIFQRLAKVHFKTFARIVGEGNAVTPTVI